MKKRKLNLILAMIMVIAFVVASCSETDTYVSDSEIGSEARINAIESSYTIVETGEEYAGVYYVFPRIEGMTNMSKQADANGNMKRLNTKTAKSNDGERGAISDSHEILIANDKLFSIIFPTTLDIDIPTRSMVMLVEEHKFIYSIDNLFGRVDGNPMFGEMRAVFEAFGASSAQSDDDFRKNLVYFKGDDMKNLELHMTYFLDGGQDIMIPFEDVTDYLLEEKAELMDFAIK